MSMHQQFAWLFGSARRISDVILVLDELDAHAEVEEARRNKQVAPPQSGQRAIRLMDATITTPGGQVLVQNLSLCVEPGGHNNLLITGAHQVGKSAVIRALSGVWPLSEGYIERPDAGLVVVPQTPLVCVLPISLLDYCTYPVQLKPSSATATEAISILTPLMHTLRVYYLVQRNDDKWMAMESWEAKLSKGEAQCISIIRALYHRPTWAVLDEATSAMAKDRAAECYHLLRQRGISCVSVAHSGEAAEVLSPFHSQTLALVAGSTSAPLEWTLTGKHRRFDSTRTRSDGPAPVVTEDEGTDAMVLDTPTVGRVPAKVPSP